MPRYVHRAFQRTHGFIPSLVAGDGVYHPEAATLPSSFLSMQLSEFFLRFVISVAI
jgi:hypothetical protein